MTDNVTVVIRSSGERTEKWCVGIVEQQVPKKNLFVIREKPFSQAVRKNFEIGIEQGKKWTLAVDADILLTGDAIEKLVGVAESLEDHFFLVQGMVLDKLFCVIRGGGPHLYRTEYLREALGFIPEEGSSLRPESHTYSKMVELGKHMYHGGEVYGIHDYDQYYSDIYRKAFLHTKKHASLSKEFKSAWEHYSEADHDYKVALLGMSEGQKFEGQVYVNTDFFKEAKARILDTLNITEKEELSEEGLDIQSYVEGLLRNYNPADIIKELAERERGYVYRSDQMPERSPGIIEKLMWLVRKTWRNQVTRN